MCSEISMIEHSFKKSFKLKTCYIMSAKTGEEMEETNYAETINVWFIYWWKFSRNDYWKIKNWEWCVGEERNIYIGIKINGHNY